MMEFPVRATIIGAGNVAWGLAPALEKGGKVKICRIIARSINSAEALASAIGPEVEASCNLSDSDKDVDLVIVAASDPAIAQIAAGCVGSRAVWLHTSGSVDSSVLAAASGNYGVVYPMQTFTRGVAVDLSDAPIFIEASTPALLEKISDIAHSVSSNVRQADSIARRRLHCAAVFACNFTNHLWAIADSIAHEAGASIADFMPLIDETLRKAKAIGPFEGQTGPARRGAQSVMKTHEAMLNPQQRDIYRLISKSIATTYEQN